MGLNDEIESSSDSLRDITVTSGRAAANAYANRKCVR